MPFLGARLAWHTTTTPNHINHNDCSMKNVVSSRSNNCSRGPKRSVVARGMKVLWGLALGWGYSGLAYSFTGTTPSMTRRSPASLPDHLPRNSFSSRSQALRMAASSSSSSSVSDSRLVSPASKDSLLDVHVVRGILHSRTTLELEGVLDQAWIVRSFQKQQQSGAHVPPSSSEPFLGWRITAAALRRLTVLSTHEELQKKNKTTQSSRSESSKVALLVQKLISRLLAELKVEQGRAEPGIFPLADLLQASSFLLTNQSLEHLLLVEGTATSSGSESNPRDDTEELAATVLELLRATGPKELKRLGPIRLIQSLQAMARVGAPDLYPGYMDSEEDEDNTPPLVPNIYQILLKPTSLGQLPAKYLAHALDTMATIVAIRGEDPDDDDDEPLFPPSSEDKPPLSDTLLLTRSFMRRLRKQVVREEATITDLCRALAATDALWHAGGMRDLEDEAAIFGFTTLRAILQKRKEAGDNSRLSPTQVADMVSSWATLTNNQKEDTVIEDLLQICQTDGIFERTTIWDLERILSSIDRLHIVDHAEDTMRLAGERLLALAQHPTNPSALSPEAVSGILKCPILLHRKRGRVMQPYLSACEHLFHHKAFLEGCSAHHAATFLWFAFMARWRHESALIALGERILDPLVVDKCSPSSACRILATYTSILSLPSTDDSTTHNAAQQRRVELHHGSLGELASDLFHAYGGHLLTSRLSPAEVSSALYAYAKMSYCQDMGIFDHLVSLMATMSSSSLEASIPPPTVRQLSQSLWSCGQMIVWESDQTQPELDSLKNGDESDEADLSVAASGPPYLREAHTIAGALAERSDELSSVDVTQSIWALGRLGLEDSEIVDALVHRADAFATSLKAVEAANIMWGLAKLDIRHHERRLIRKLADRLVFWGTTISPKEAAMALYALGRMQWADEEVYAALCNVMIRRIDETSAQSIANALWAYRHVGLKPPQELINLWATEKLGLVGIQLPGMNVGSENSKTGSVEAEP